MFLIIIQMDIELGKREGGGGEGVRAKTESQSGGSWIFNGDFVRVVNSMKFSKVHNFM